MCIPKSNVALFLLRLIFYKYLLFMSSNRSFSRSRKTGCVINIKRGSFSAVGYGECFKKVVYSGNPNVMLCERGTSFGYNRLISDMRSLPILRSFGAPVIFDATHSVQEPGGQGTSSGGQRQFVEILARAAVSVGVAGIFRNTSRSRSCPF